MNPQKPDQIVHNIRFEFHQLVERLADLSIPIETTTQEMNALCRKVNEHVEILPEDLKEELSRAFLRLKTTDGVDVFSMDI